MMDQSRGHDAQTVHSNVCRKAFPDFGTWTQSSGAVGAAGLALSVAVLVVVSSAEPEPSVAILRKDVERAAAAGLETVRYARNFRATPLGIMSMFKTFCGRVDDGSIRCIMSSAAGKAALREAVTARGRWREEDWPWRDEGVVVVAE